mgnify:CR=1 FL=1
MTPIAGLFLLGGHDLEMLTIRDVLDAHGSAYADHQLRWDNAKLSSYRDEIERFERENAQGCIYGIELENDLTTFPECYRSIDHHNEQSKAPSALEQVLSLLNIPMNREYELIAANDKRYIPGMLALGATDDDVRHIRRADRHAQGVTEEDEALAEKAVSENLRRVGDLIVVKAFNSRFSPICDRLYPYRSLLIYTDAEWMFYGYRAQQVRELFMDEYHKGKIFYGGGPNGYVGAKASLYTELEICEMMKKIEQEYV